MTFASVYPLYLAKVQRKGRTQEELNCVITWLTGYNEMDIEAMITNQVSFETFFSRARLSPGYVHITGVICGYRIEDIENTLVRQIRCLDKLVDELAKGKKLDVIGAKLTNR